MCMREGENRLVLLWVTLCSDAQFGIFSYSSIWSSLKTRNSHSRYVWHFNTMHDNRWKPTRTTVTNDYRQYNHFRIYSTTFAILPNTSSRKPLWSTIKTWAGLLQIALLCPLYDFFPLNLLADSFYLCLLRFTPLSNKCFLCLERLDIRLDGTNNLHLLHL